MKTTESREDLLGSCHNIGFTSSTSLQAPYESFLTPVEKKFLLFAERGDVASVRRLLIEYKDKPQELDINCVDPLNRTALIAAIENENIELIRSLLEENIKVHDALLHAIKEQYVEAVEVLLEWEEKIHVHGQPYSWEAVDRSASTFTSDITPLVLSAHMNNYEIIKILLDRGATLPTPHDVRCGCDDCILSSETDSLRHSQARINAYKALSASSLIALSSRDPLLTAFELSWELRRLSFCETEFRKEYNEMRASTQDFATSLLDHARTSMELEVMLNFNPLEPEPWEPGERQTLDRLKLALKYKQKRFVAHPNVQQLLASIWYDGLPGFRRKSMISQLIEVGKLGCMFPIYSSIYMLAPNSTQGQFIKKPFVKFILHSSSYMLFLMLLGLASQRAEYMVIEWFGPAWMQDVLADWKRRERGSFPGLVESALVIYIFSWITNEVRALWCDGIAEYISDLWNIVDFITNCFYMIWISLRATAIFITFRESWAGLDPYIPREKWDPFDPMLLSEGAFAAGMIFSFLKLVHIFSVNPHLGPLQISLGRMIIDIIKFFFIYTLVLFAFGCGMNQLLWYYADLERSKCYVFPDDPDLPDFETHDKACTVWRRFANLFETSQSLFWASFGLVDILSFDLAGIKSFTRFWALLLFGSYCVINVIVLLNLLIAMMSNSYNIISSLFWASFGLVDITSFDLEGIKSFTRFWALLLFGSYSVINIIVLLNMLIAMMSNSFQIISERSDVEWKFARSRLWMSYFDEGNTLPAPFNMMPTVKMLSKMLGCGNKPKDGTGSMKNKSAEKSQVRHDTVMRLLVRRYVTAEQRKRDDFGITEDDVIEIRQDISTLRYELIDILKRNGMKTPDVKDEVNAVTKKGKVMERRLVKDFHIGIVEGIINEAILQDKGPQDVFTKIARAIGKRASGASGKKKDWNALVRKNTLINDPIGSADERKERAFNRQSIRRYIIEQNAALTNPDPERLIEYNPKLSSVTPATRVAYAKFKINKIKQEFQEKEDMIRRGVRTSSVNYGDGQSVTTGDDDVFDKKAAPSKPTSTKTSPLASVSSTTSNIVLDNIVRPRPRSSISSLAVSGAIAGPPKTPPKSPPTSDAPAAPDSTEEETISVSAELKKDLRARSPILEDPTETSSGLEPQTRGVSTKIYKPSKKPAIKFEDEKDPGRGEANKFESRSSQIQKSPKIEVEDSDTCDVKRKIAELEKNKAQEVKSNGKVEQVEEKREVKEKFEDQNEAASIGSKSSKMSVKSSVETKEEIKEVKENEQKEVKEKKDLKKSVREEKAVGKKEKEAEKPKSLGPTKPGGKSKVTGEIITGWL